MTMPTGAPPTSISFEPGVRAATESSQISRVVALLTPLFAIAAGTLAGWVAKRTGAVLDQTAIAAFMVAVATSVVAAGWKWLHGWQLHEQLVAHRLDVPVKAGPDAPLPPGQP